MRYFMYALGDENDPRLSAPPSPETMGEMGAFVEEAFKSGALIATGGFGHSATGMTVTLADGEFTVTDGPFAEAKELVGGWALVEAATKEDAVDWARRFLKIIGGGESRIRPVF
jgi:hypothetical protein